MISVPLVRKIGGFLRTKLLIKTSKSPSKVTKAQLTLFTPAQLEEALKSADLPRCDGKFVSKMDVETVQDGANPPTPLVQYNGNDLMCMDETLSYVRDFLGQPNPLVGRTGPTCPFVPVALKQQCLYLGIVHTNDKTTASELEEIMKCLVERFAQLEPRSGRLLQYKAVVITFPDIPLSRAVELVDGVQYRLKAEFVSRGFMLGEFHQLNNAPGLRNPNFYPLRTPHPALAIRHMVPTDLAFLDMEKYPKEMRVKFLESYIRTLNTGTSKTVSQQRDITAAEELLTKLKMEQEIDLVAPAPSA